MNKLKPSEIRTYYRDQQVSGAFDELFDQFGEALLWARKHSEREQVRRGRWKAIRHWLLTRVAPTLLAGLLLRLLHWP